MELTSKQIVKLRNGNVGVVVGWGNKPTYLVAATFVNTIDKWDENGDRVKAKETPNKYDIMTIYDGSAVEEPTQVFKSSFNFDELPVVWSREV